MAKVTASKRGSNDRETVQAKTKSAADRSPTSFNWWEAKGDAELVAQVLDTVAFLKEQQGARFRQASMQARMYGNLPLMNFAGSTLNMMSSAPSTLPIDRPTMNVVQSCVDTLVARIGQSKPKPMFLTDGGDYKARKLSKQMNAFISGEFYQLKAYELMETALKDASVLGDGIVKVFETDDKRVGAERVLPTELLVDGNDGFYGKPRCIYHIKLVDRTVLAQLLPKERSRIAAAEQAYPDSSEESQKTASDQIMIAEAWHLPSSKEATDGRHVIVCTSGLLLDEEYTKRDFPFVRIPYSPRLVGFWSQGLAEQLTGTQVEINKLLITISKSIALVGVPSVWVEDGSKVVKSHFNNQIGNVHTYRNTLPTFIDGKSGIAADIYAQLQRLIDYAYQQSGISSLAATSQKPAGLNSGEAIRSYDDLQSDRFAILNKRYDNAFIELAYKIIDLAKEIALRDGEYQTIYPNKDGTKEIDLPEAKKLDDSFVIQCYDSNALPKDPAGRKQAIVDDMQSGILTLQEGRRLLNYSDLEQDDKLAIAGEERILKTLDDIVEDGKYVPPDPFMDLQMAMVKLNQYYNLYVANGLEESKAEMLRTWQSQLLMLQQAAMPPAPPAMPGAAPQGMPTARPTNDLLPQVPK